MKIGIIIPTKNEEKFLPFLAKSILIQTYNNYMVIVADANSEDNTRTIAKEFGFTVVDGGMPFEGRNNGAMEALNNQCNLLIFIDADIILPSKYFLETALREFKVGKYDIAGTYQIPYGISNDDKIKISKNFKYRAIYGIANIAMWILKNSKRPMFQVCMFATSEAHKRIGGFRALEYGEDSRYAIDGKQLGMKFGMLKSPKKVLISPRRFEEKGLIKSGTLYFLSGVLLGKKFIYGKGGRKYF